MYYDFLNVRATYTASDEQTSFGSVLMEALDAEGLAGEPLQQLTVAGFGNTEEELKQLIINTIYPVPAVHPPEGSPERAFGEATQYMSARKESYPEIGDQLDMIYKDMVSGGTSFVDAIKNIKDSIPKPENIERPPSGVVSEAYKQERLDVWNEMYGFNLTMQEFYGE